MEKELSREEVIKAIGTFIKHVAISGHESAELSILPEMAKIYFDETREESKE